MGDFTLGAEQHGVNCELALFDGGRFVLNTVSPQPRKKAASILRELVTDPPSGGEKLFGLRAAIQNIDTTATEVCHRNPFGVSEGPRVLGSKERSTVSVISLGDEYARAPNDYNTNLRRFSAAQVWMP